METGKVQQNKWKLNCLKKEEMPELSCLKAIFYFKN